MIKCRNYKSVEFATRNKKRILIIILDQSLKKIIDASTTLKYSPRNENGQSSSGSRTHTKFIKQI